MTRKRFKKLLMGQGHSRRDANDTADTVAWRYKGRVYHFQSYQYAWDNCYGIPDDLFVECFLELLKSVNMKFAEQTGNEFHKGEMNENQNL